MPTLEVRKLRPTDLQAHCVPGLGLSREEEEENTAEGADIKDRL